MSAVLVDEAAARDFVAGLPGVDGQAMARLEVFAALLRAENQRQNLVSAASLGAVWLRHIADSAQLLRHVPRETGLWLDLGTGAGFPGLVIAMLRPDSRLVMVDSRPRRCEWLESVVAELGLVRARVLASRVEKLPAMTAGVISARAFAPLDRLLDISARFSTEVTRWLLPKGRGAAQELRELTGWRHRFHVEQSLTDAEAGVIVGELLGRAARAKPAKKPGGKGVVE